MEQKYSCSLTLICKPEYFKETFLRVIDNLNYTPDYVSCFFNEFKRPPSIERLFDKGYLLENISTKEMKGITSISIYDSNYSSTNVTPYVRIKFNVNKEIENSYVSLEWIAFNNFDFLVKNDQVIYKYLSNNNILNYCYICNQIDTYYQSNNPETWFKKNYGKLIRVGGIEFQAAPIMYFGNAFDSIIPKNKLIAAGGILLNENIIKFELGNLYSEPKEYRKEQKKYWKSVNLDGIIKSKSSINKIDAFQDYKRRYELYKQK